MNKEELINLNMKDVILNKWKSKLSYPLNHKDIEELENIIDYYEGLNQEYKEVIDKVSSQIKLYGKYNGEKCTRGFSMMSADFNKLLEILKEVE